MAVGSRVIVVPYHLGHRAVSMGRGPLALQEAAALNGHDPSAGGASEVTLPVGEGADHEVGRCFALLGEIASEVAGAAAAGEGVVALAGNCHHCLGILAGLPHPVGIVWFDAHGDFNDPETTASGFFDGFALNMAVGRSWKTALRTVPGFTPVHEGAVVHLGARDLDSAEHALLDASAVAVHEWPAVQRDPAAVDRSLEALRRVVDRVYVHVDIDVLDGDVYRANPFSPPGGMALSDLLDALDALARRFVVPAATVASYDPASDLDGKTAEAAVEIVQRLRTIVAPCA